MRKNHTYVRSAKTEQYDRTTYIGQVMAKERNEEPDEEEATRMGYLALLWFSLGAMQKERLIDNSLFNSSSCCDRRHSFASVGQTRPKVACIWRGGKRGCRTGSYQEPTERMACWSCAKGETSETSCYAFHVKKYLVWSNGAIHFDHLRDFLYHHRNSGAKRHLSCSEY